MKGLFSDTLSKRLLLLMWGALVASHLIAFSVVRWVHFAESPGIFLFQGLPTLPSLPPTPGLPDFGGVHGPWPGAADGPHRFQAPAIPWSALALDYGVRFVVIAVAAWLGSRWLALPVNRLVKASAVLGRSISSDSELPKLDERAGTIEVREAARVFNQMASQLQEHFMARSLMVAAISHDLRTPLTRIRMRLESMPERLDFQSKTVSDIREMNALIDSVLEVFRPDELALAEGDQWVDLAALAMAAADDFAEQGHEVGFQGERTVLRAKPSMLRRVLNNLIGNAIRYGERAEVHLSIDEQWAHIIVDDEGPGIPEDKLEAVFQPFFRIDHSRSRATGGVGLGLFIVRDLLHKQGGKEALSNRRTGGLRATVSLPMVR